MKKIMTIAFLIVLAAFAGQAFAFQDVDVATAYNMATTDPNVYIVDVRTAAEWQWVGHPGANKLGTGAALAGKVVNISYQIDYKGAFVINPSFMTDVAQLFAGNPNITLITMCRSGHRSRLAAIDLEAAGYRAMNMVKGFEGDTDAYGYRTVNGWKASNLPYTFKDAGYAD